ncbi:MAG: type II toxin-antitoxin system Phd/YefM family antitoxin [Devosia nanyangense]|uniref:Type II toxin-antitoxin system Phd/YefM family antitoxin n=1 Tax=Devosia nanyangense TaxID=1228055 RepID=A0A933NUS9_9HYPH|nr:type II toxin-antitoxin system Phd/YefM family antitoxin [Devosia nanyangense]
MSVSITGEQLQKNPGYLRSEARRSPVVVTYHGRAELVVMSVEDYETLRRNRQIPHRLEDLPADKLARLAASKMDERHAALNALMDE